MKIQNFAIIFLIILIPLIIILAYYLNLQQDTLKMQVEYDTKLAEATKEGIKAYEINTVDWATRKADGYNRKNVTSIINTFITSLSNNLQISGIAKEYMLNYIPATAVTMYDGYYIYSPSYVPVTLKNENGVQLFLIEDGTPRGYISDQEEVDLVLNGEYQTIKGKVIYEPANGTTYKTAQYNKDFIKYVDSELLAKKEYKHTLNNKIAYSAKYKDNNVENIVVNYTLDNRVFIYGNIGGEYIEKNGYLVYFNGYLSQDSNYSLTYNGVTIKPETLTEQIIYIDENTKEIKTGEFRYIYDSEHQKVYYYSNRKYFILNNDNTRLFLSNNTEKYRERLKIKTDGTTYERTKENILNLSNATFLDYSAINYYVEAYTFTNWVKSKLGGENLTQEKLIYNKDSSSENKNDRWQFTDVQVGKIFNINESNNPEDPNSLFSQHKKNVMKDNMVTNLNLSISNYNGNSENEFRLPELNDSDWERIFSNISLITFFQGAPIGLKTYNNYAIATSTTNREFVDPNEIYFIYTNDKNYHKAYCQECNQSINYTGYRGVDFALKKYTNNEKTVYYYKHPQKTACYYCVVNRANYIQKSNGKQNEAYYTALGRERYYHLIK